MICWQLILWDKMEKVDASIEVEFPNQIIDTFDIFQKIVY